MDEMVLWFSDGKYVMKALDLKNRMGMLTGEEKEKYDSQFIPKLTPVEDADSINEEKPAQEVKTAEEDGPVIESVAIDERDVNSAESLQEKNFERYQRYLQWKQKRKKLKKIS